MKNFVNEPLKITINSNKSDIFMEWSGQSTDQSPGLKLMPYLDNLMGELKGHSLRISFGKLEYMNSSSVLPIIQFMKKLDSGNIKTMIIYNSRSKWQSASFKAFETLAMMMKNITVQGE